jgi:hypothetical protein
MRPQTAHSTALSRSASASTIIGSLLPSSMVDFLRFLAARLARMEPVRVLPVKAIAAILGSSISRPI